MEPFAWTCPFCGRDTTITYENFEVFNFVFAKDNYNGDQVGYASFIACPNKKCKKIKLTLSLYKFNNRYARDSGVTKPIPEKIIGSWTIIPQSQAKPMPDYIPKALIEDYNEACIIKNLSPKASATLSRRCLQTMIRNFWKVKDKPNLKQEIDAIKDQVDPITWKAIDSVRSIGNIGAHMEKDINLIIDVDPKEADLLIQLIEQLIKDWYITRYERDQNMKGIIQASSKKKTIKKKAEIQTNE